MAYLDADECLLMEFPKTEIDPRLIKLQEMIFDFITDIIIRHEKKMFEVVHKLNSPRVDFITTTNQTVIDMISLCTHEFYNKCYFDMQHGINNDITNIIKQMEKLVDYGWWVLLDKLIRMTIDTHINVVREDIMIDSEELFFQTIYDQVYEYLCDRNLIHVFCKGPNDDIKFMEIPEHIKPFDIIIDKKINC